MQLLIERPLDLDESPPAELLALVRERLNGEPAETPATAGGLYTAMTAAFVKAGADEAEAAQQARQVISDAGFDGLTHVDRRYENHHRVWMAFRAEQVVEIERELL